MSPFAAVRVEADPRDAQASLLHVKAVPGAKRTELAGVLGDRLKVRVSQPPEDGKANRAIRELLAARLGVRASDVEIVRGISNAEKVVRVTGLSVDELRAKLGSLAC